jgi:hypothetical protein
MEHYRPGRQALLATWNEKLIVMQVVWMGKLRGGSRVIRFLLQLAQVSLDSAPGSL